MTKPSNFSKEDLEKAEKTDDISQLDDKKGNDEDLSAQLEAKEEEITSLKDELLRTVAETENVRKRAQKDKEDAVKYGVTQFAREILNVADNMERALKSIKPEDRESNEAVKSICTGIEMTEQLLAQTFEKQGIQKIDPVGQAFDHNFHQAMVEIDSSEHAAGTVIEVFQPGYVLHDRLLRPAMVSVAKSSNKSDDNDNPTPPSIDTEV